MHAVVTLNAATSSEGDAQSLIDYSSGKRACVSLRRYERRAGDVCSLRTLLVVDFISANLKHPRLRTAAARVLRESAFFSGDASVPIRKLRYGTGDSIRFICDLSRPSLDLARPSRSASTRQHSPQDCSEEPVLIVMLFTVHSL